MNQNEDELQKIDAERIKEQIKDSKAQEEAYKKLLYNQRDIMDGLKSTLFEKETLLSQTQKENDSLKIKLNDINKIFKLKNDYIDSLENILDKNNIKYKKENFENILLNHYPLKNDSISISSDKDNKIYIPYETEQNHDNNDIPNPLTLLTSEEKIKELNDLVSYKDNEITLLKKVSEKIFSNANYKKDDLKDEHKNSNENIKKLEEEIKNLKTQLSEKIKIINLQRQEKEKLEDYYSSIVQLNHQTEKENLILLNSKETLISKLGGVIEKIDSSNYNENMFQSLRTDLVKIFQIVLNNSIDDFSHNKSTFIHHERRQSETSYDSNHKNVYHKKKSNSLEITGDRILLFWS